MAGARAERLMRTDPVGRIRQRVRIDALRLVVARIAPDDLVVRANDLERDVLRLARQVVVEDRAVRRVLPGRLLGRQRRVGEHVPPHARARPAA